MGGPLSPLPLLLPLPLLTLLALACRGPEEEWEEPPRGERSGGA